MANKYCTHCGTLFEARYPNAKLCYACFQKREQALEQHDGLLQKLARAREELSNISETNMPTDILSDLVEVLDTVDTPQGEQLYNYFADLLRKKTKQKHPPRKDKYPQPITPSLFD